MNRLEIVAQAREWLDDELEPYLWATTSLQKWAEEAVVEYALRTRALVDSTTPAVCEVTVVEGQAVYPLHASIVVVRRFEYRRPDVLPEVLTRRTTAYMDRNFGGSWAGMTGRPYIVIPDLQARTFRLDRIPTAADVGTIHLQVWRKPLTSEAMTQDDSVPPVDEAFHRQLVHWICHRAYQKRDSETYNATSSADQLAQFEAAFGSRPTQQRLIELSTDDAGEVESYWY